MLNWWSPCARRRTDNSRHHLTTDRVQSVVGSRLRTWKETHHGHRYGHHQIGHHASGHATTTSSHHHHASNGNGGGHVHYQAGAALAAFLLAWIATFELVEGAARKDGQQEQPRISYGLQPFAAASPPRDYDEGAGSTRRSSSLEYVQKGQQQQQSGGRSPGATSEVMVGGAAISSSSHRRDQSPNSVYSNQRLPKRQSNQWSGHSAAQSNFLPFPGSSSHREAVSGFRPSSSEGVGGGGHAAFSPAISHSESFAAGSSSSAAFSSLLNLHYEQPSFDPATPRNVTGQQGQTVYLHCVVRNLGDKTVSWIRRKDFHVLTVGVVTYTTDERFQAVHNEATQDWMLQIRLTNVADAGSYECQVNSHPLISLFVNLTVLVPKANIQGSPDLYVKTGSAINLTCVIRDSPEPPVFIFWYHDDRMINYDSTRGEISIQKAGDDTTLSRLFIPRVQPADSGNYTCGPSNADATRISVHVLNGEKPAAMQHDVSPSGAASSAKMEPCILWAYSLWCCTHIVLLLLRKTSYNGHQVRTLS